MPLLKKVKLTRDFKFQLPGHYGLGDSTTILKEAGMLVGNSLIMDEGSKMRVEGFSAAVSDKTYPRVKVTIYPEGKKQCQLYLDMEQMDGVTWETIEGDVPKEKKEVQRINVSLGDRMKDEYHWSKQGFWHDAFGSYHPRNSKEDALLNPQKLSKTELEKLEFKTSSEHDIGEAVVKKGKESHMYKFKIKSVFYFSIDVKPGLMYAKLVDIKDTLVIGRGSYPGRDDWKKISDVNSFDEPDYAKVITDYLKKEHNFE
jgi:hypothetical protein